MTHFNNSFTVFQDSNLEEMEIGTVAVLFNPFPTYYVWEMIFEANGYWFGIETTLTQSGQESTLYFDRDFSYITQEENLKYNEWKMAVVTVQKSPAFE